MRLVDADNARECFSGDGVTGAVMQRMFDSLPTIDAVPVVRCRECVYKDTTACPAYDAPFARTSLRIKFCSEGRRREGDHEISEP